MDLRPLRESPAFRRLWAGSCLSSIGEQMTTFAVMLQVFTLTHHSAAAVGGVGLASAVPALLFGLFGGALTDAADRRTLVLAVSSALAVVSALFAAQAFAGSTRIWPLYALVAAQSLLNTVNVPARRTFMPRLLPADRIPAGAALNLFNGHLSVTLGPALAGVVTAAWGLRACYLIDLVSFAAALYGVGRLPAMPPEGGDTRPGVRSVVEGLRFLRGDRVLAGALLADVSATVLGMPFGILPSINAEHFGNSPHTLGLLMAAPAVGGIIGSALSGPVARVSRHGCAMLVAGAVWGAGIAGFGLAPELWLAFALLVVAGTADVISVLFRATIVQVVTPDRYRGRVGAADYVVGVGCPRLGNFRAGVVGSLATPTSSVVGGGLAAIAGAGLIGLVMPAFARYRATPARAAAAEATAAP
jgi:MFS family permease